MPDESTAVGAAQRQFPDGFAAAHVPHDQRSLLAGQQQSIVEHGHTAGEQLAHGQRVEQVALEPLPHAQFIVGAHTDDVRRRVRQQAHAAVVSLHTVDARAARQVPQAEHSVLTAAAHGIRVAPVDEQGRDGSAVTVQAVRRRQTHLQRPDFDAVVLRTGDDAAGFAVQHRNGLLVRSRPVQPHQRYRHFPLHTICKKKKLIKKF